MAQQSDQNNESTKQAGRGFSKQEQRRGGETSANMQQRDEEGRFAGQDQNESQTGSPSRMRPGMAPGNGPGVRPEGETGASPLNPPPPGREMEDDGAHADLENETGAMGRGRDSNEDTFKAEQTEP